MLLKGEITGKPVVSPFLIFYRSVEGKDTSSYARKSLE